MDSLKATMGLDATDYARTLAKAEKQAATSGNRIANNLAGPTVSAARGKGLGGGASAMFVSVARDSAASLASGANPFTVLMQQGPQVLQALTMMRISMMALLRVIVPVGVALAAAFATHVVSKGIAEMIYGLDRLESKGKRLKEWADMMRKMRLDVEEARLASIRFAADQIDSANSVAEATAKRLAAERALLREQRQAENLKGQIIGNSDQGMVAEEEQINSENAALRARLAAIEDYRGQNTPDSAETLRARAALKELTATPFLKRDEMYYAKKDAAESELAASRAKDVENRYAEIASLKAEIQKRENRLTELYNPQIKEDKKLSRTAMEGLRFGSRMELPPGQLELQNNVRDIARNVRDIATKPTAPSEGVKF